MLSYFRVQTGLSYLETGGTVGEEESVDLADKFRHFLFSSVEPNQKVDEIKPRQLRAFLVGRPANTYQCLQGVDNSYLNSSQYSITNDQSVLKTALIVYTWCE